MTDDDAKDRSAGSRDERVLAGLSHMDTDVDVDNDDEDVDLVEAFGLPDRLPPLRLPDEVELALAARGSELLARAHALALWVGQGREVTDDGELTAVDAVAAAAAIGSAPAPGAGSTLAGMRDLPGLLHLWRLAEQVGFLDFDEERVATAASAEDWPDATDDAVLEVWQEALADTLAFGLIPDGEPSDVDELALHDVGGAAMVMLFLSRATGIPRAELGDVVREGVTAHLTPARARLAWNTWVARHGDPAALLLDRLVDLGAVELTGEDVRLTALSTWAVRAQLIESGVQVPLLPPVERMSAAELVASVPGSTDQELAEDVEAWLALRGPQDAARELLEVAAAGGPAERMHATTMATEIGAAAAPQWRRMLDHRSIRPYAKIALAGGGVESGALPEGLVPDQEDLAWLLTDVLAATAEDLDPGELELQLREVIPPGHESAMFEVMWRLPHDHVRDVLTMIGDNHPDKAVAKAARKAAFRASSRG